MISFFVFASVVSHIKTIYVSSPTTLDRNIEINLKFRKIYKIYFSVCDVLIKESRIQMFIGFVDVRGILLLVEKRYF